MPAPLLLDFALAFGGRASSRSSPRALAACATLFLATGIAAAIPAGRDFRRANAAERWPATPGVIEDCRMVRVNSGGSQVPQLAVSYAYEAGGVRRRGHRLAATCGPERGAAAAVERYPAGTPVAVRVNPDDPDDALLEPRVAGPAWGLAAAATLALTLSGLWFAEAWRRRPA